MGVVHERSSSTGGLRCHEQFTGGCGAGSSRSERSLLTAKGSLLALDRFNRTLLRSYELKIIRKRAWVLAKHRQIGAEDGLK